MAAEHVRELLRRSLVRNVHHLHAGSGTQQFAGEVRSTADPRRGVRKLPGSRLGEHDELLDIARGYRWMHEQNRISRDRARDGSEIFDRIVTLR